MVCYQCRYSDEFLQKIFAQDNETELTVDLSAQTIMINIYR